MQPEEMYRQIFRISQEAAFVVRPDGTLLDANPAGLEMFGYSSMEDKPGYNVATECYALPRDREAVLRHLGESGYVKDFRLTLKKRDGTRITALANISVLRDEAGKIVAHQGTFRDITEQVRTEEALRESEERLKLTLEAAHIVAWEINADGSHREAGPVHELFGRPKGFYHPELSNLYESVHPDDRRKLESLVGAVLRGEREFRIEFRVPQESGSERWVEGVGTLQRGTEGRPARILGIAHDISRRKLAEEGLRRSEERFKRLVLNSNDIFSLLDENGDHTSISGPIDKVLGFKPEEVEGFHFADYWHPDDEEKGRTAFLDALLHPGSSRSLEYRLRHKDGHWVTVESTITNLLKEPAVNAIVANTRDISERKRLQEQLQQAMKMEAVGRLAGGIAHDFNNILTVINGNVELARMSLSPSDPLNQPMDQVARAADSAASLTCQLLAFSRKQIIEPKVLNLNELVGNIRQMLRRLIGENIELKTALQENLGSVKVDPGQFEQVLVNLAVNARDAMPEGGKLTIETRIVTLDDDYCATRPYSQPGNFILVAVSDTGQGITDEVKSHLFEPFFTTKGKGRGTGLGLATTFGIVKQAGGAIEVYSEAGQGSTFKIYLPLVDKEAEKMTRDETSTDMGKGGETILLVEDDAGVRLVSRAILKKLGYRVIEARDGEEALMLAERHEGRFDLLMTDIVMPGMNGRELSERLTGLYPAVKTLFASGYTEDIIVHHGILDSSLNFINKPYSLQGLARKIREILGRPSPPR